MTPRAAIPVVSVEPYEDNPGVDLVRLGSIPAELTGKVEVPLVIEADGISLREHFLNDSPVDIRQPELPALELERQPFMIDPEKMQDRRLQVVNVNAALGHVEAEVVGAAMRMARLHAATRHPQ